MPARPLLTHFGLHVRNADASIAFYRRYCGLEVIRSYGPSATERTVWLGDPENPSTGVLVLISGGAHRPQGSEDMTHFGFAVAERSEVDRLAREGEAAGCLHWTPRNLPFPAGYLCALADPDGYVVEFSFGQPLGRGAD